MSTAHMFSHMSINVDAHGYAHVYAHAYSHDAYAGSSSAAPTPKPLPCFLNPTEWDMGGFTAAGQWLELNQSHIDHVHQECVRHVLCMRWTCLLRHSMLAVLLIFSEIDINELMPRNVCNACLMHA